MDAAEFSPTTRFDLVISISTLQHLGWGRDGDDPEKIERLLKRMRRDWLAPEGHFLATVPLGYNPHLDRLLRPGRAGVDFLRRISVEGEWEQIGTAAIGEPRYGEPFPRANVLAVLSLAATPDFGTLGTCCGFRAPELTTYLASSQGVGATALRSQPALEGLHLPEPTPNSGSFTDPRIRDGDPLNRALFEARMPFLHRPGRVSLETLCCLVPRLADGVAGAWGRGDAFPPVLADGGRLGLP